MPAPPVTPASSFVTVTAKVSIVLGIGGTLYALVQLLAASLLLGHGEWERALGALPLHELPPAAAWLLTHLHAIAVAMLLVFAGFLAVSVGLLRRRRWAWWGFNAYMVLGALANFALVVAIDQLFAWMQALPAHPDMAALQSELGSLRRLSLLLTAGSAIVFAVLHGLIVWKLCRPDIRATFRRG